MIDKNKKEFFLHRCPGCGEMFSATRPSLCFDCRSKEAAHIDQLRKYYDNNPECDWDTLTQETRFSKARIIQYLKQGKFILDKQTKINYPCDNCNQPINKGLICVPCQHEFAFKFMKTTVKNQPDKPDNRE